MLVQGCEKVLSQSFAQYFMRELRQNQKASLRGNLPGLLTGLSSFLEHREPDHLPALKRHSPLRLVYCTPVHFVVPPNRFQDYFLEELEDGTTGLDQVMSFLIDEKVWPETIEVLLGLSLENPRAQARISENKEAMAHLSSAKESGSCESGASLLLSRLAKPEDRSRAPRVDE